MSDETPLPDQNPQGKRPTLTLTGAGLTPELVAEVARKRRPVALAPEAL